MTDPPAPPPPAASFCASARGLSPFAEISRPLPPSVMQRMTIIPPPFAPPVPTSLFTCPAPPAPPQRMRGVAPTIAGALTPPRPPLSKKLVQPSH